MNQKTTKLFRKYARQKTDDPALQKKIYKKLKQEFNAHIREG